MLKMILCSSKDVRTIINTKNQLLKSQARVKRIQKQLGISQSDLFDAYGEINRFKKRLG